ncbi:response regulator transcription factor [Arundinibacter roseus]|uniref:Response regulator transcription factor n=1 Tax=Arundinibacter roseus TaxID=2070510 RepID=A0A4R4KLJ3_9BACT|nr:response regulator transcription factor [Arundinibacter roseus]TDB69234.1 response regulator transcription factor [Arundinibacter roseus]
MKARILYVEDDPNLAFATKDNLEAYEFEIIHCTNGRDGWDTFQKEYFDLCILDIMLPEMDGFTLAKHIREVDKHVPLLFLSARSLLDDKLHGLEIGADDYITKPFSIKELVLRIEVFLRRSKLESPATQPGQTYQIGNYIFDFQKLTLKNNEKSSILTFREAEVLKYLAERSLEVVRREDLLKAIWGNDDYFMGRSLDVFISRLRKYLSGDTTIRIDNVHGVGFRMSWEK